MANPNVEAAYFWVQVGQNETNKKYKVKGSDFPNVAKGTEIVWVQRGDNHYWTWYGQPKDLDSPDFSYRFKYYVTPAVDANSGKTQPNGDGLINFSLYFENPGPYPVNEWRNIRNQQQVIKDLDNKELVLYKNTELSDGDVCRITHEGGNFEAWYAVDDPNGNDFLKFKSLYTKGEGDTEDERNRPRTDIKRTGSRPDADGTQVLRLDFFSKSKLKPFSRIANSDWVWAMAKDANNEWQHYRVSGENFKELFAKETVNFEVTSGTVQFNMRMRDTSKTYVIERVEDGWTRNVSGSYTNTSLGVGNYFIPMDDCEWFKVENSSGYFDFKPNFNTSNVTCMYRALYNCSNFNGAVNHFDLSGVTNTSQMFYNSRKFNKSISGWDLSSCTNASQMFMHAVEFNGEVDDLVFGETNCDHMFFNANKFNQSLTNWDTANITNASYMFNNCRSFNKPINHLNFTGTNNVSYAFRNCVVFNQDFSGVDWGIQTNFAYAFFNCRALNHPSLRTWPFPSHAYNISYALGNCSNFRQSIAGWTEPIPGYASGLFYGWTQFNQRVSHLNFSNASICCSFFAGCSIFNADDIGDLDLGSAARASGFFKDCTALDRDLGKWDVSNLWDMASFFMNTNCRHFNIGGWDVSRNKYFNNMFRSSIVGDDLSGWDTSIGTRFQNMFMYWGTKTGKLSTSDKLDIKIDNWDMRRAENIQNMFLSAGDKDYIANISTNAWRMPNMMFNFNLSNTSQQAWMDWNTNANFIEGIPGLGMPVIEPGYEPTYTIFGGPINSKIYFSGVSNWTISDGMGVKNAISSQLKGMGLNITNAQIDLFEESPGHVKFNPDTDYRASVNQHNWEFMEAYGPHPELMNSPTNMYNLFAVDTRSNGGWKLSNVTGFGRVNTKNVTNMARMFSYQGGISGELNIGDWDVEQVNNMDSMFIGPNEYGPENRFKAGDLSGWCVRNVTSKPANWPSITSSDIVEVDPYWGLCPDDPDFVPPIQDRPLPPNGNWNRQGQGYWFSLDKNATLSSYHIHLGSYMCKRWRSRSGSQDWESMSDSNAIDIAKGYQYIVTQASGREVTFSTNAPIRFHGIDISNMSNLTNMFRGATNFNDNISWWDTSDISNMSNMFNGAVKFNQNLSGWNVSGVGSRSGFDYNTPAWDPSYKPKF